MSTQSSLRLRRKRRATSCANTLARTHGHHGKFVRYGFHDGTAFSSNSNRNNSSSSNSHSDSEDSRTESHDGTLHGNILANYDAWHTRLAHHMFHPTSTMALPRNVPHLPSTSPLLPPTPAHSPSIDFGCHGDTTTTATNSDGTPSLRRPLLFFNAYVSTHFLPRINPLYVRTIDGPPVGHHHRREEDCYHDRRPQTGEEVPALVVRHVNAHSATHPLLMHSQDLPPSWHNWLAQHKAQTLASTQPTYRRNNQSFHHVNEHCIVPDQVTWKWSASPMECVALANHLCKSTWFDDVQHFAAFRHQRPQSMVILADDVKRVFTQRSGPTASFERSNYGGTTNDSTPPDTLFTTHGLPHHPSHPSHPPHPSSQTFFESVDPFDDEHDINDDLPFVEGYCCGVEHPPIHNATGASTIFNDVGPATDFQQYRALKAFIDYMLIYRHHGSERSYNAFFHMLVTSPPALDSIDTFLHAHAHIFASDFEGIKTCAPDAADDDCRGHGDFNGYNNAANNNSATLTTSYHHIVNHVATTITHLATIDESVVDERVALPTHQYHTNQQKQNQPQSQQLPTVQASCTYPVPTFVMHQPRPTRSPWSTVSNPNVKNHENTADNATFVPSFLLLEHNQIHLEMLATRLTSPTRRRLCFSCDVGDSVLLSNKILLSARTPCDFVADTNTLHEASHLARLLASTRNDLGPTLQASCLLYDIYLTRKIQTHNVGFRKLFSTTPGRPTPEQMARLAPHGTCRHTFPSQRNLQLSDITHSPSPSSSCVLAKTNMQNVDGDWSIIFTSGNRLESYLYTHLLCAYDLTLQQPRQTTVLSLCPPSPSPNKEGSPFSLLLSSLRPSNQHNTTTFHRGLITVDTVCDVGTQTDKLRFKNISEMGYANNNMDSSDMFVPDMIDVSQIVRRHRINLTLETSLSNLVRGCPRTFLQVSVSFHTFEKITFVPPVPGGTDFSRHQQPSTTGDPTLQYVPAHRAIEFIFRGANHLEVTLTNGIAGTPGFYSERTNVIRHMALFLLTCSASLPAYTSDFIIHSPQPQQAQQQPQQQQHREFKSADAASPSQDNVHTVIAILNDLITHAGRGNSVGTSNVDARPESTPQTRPKGPITEIRRIHVNKARAVLSVDIRVLPIDRPSTSLAQTTSTSTMPTARIDINASCYAPSQLVHRSVMINSILHLPLVQTDGDDITLLAFGANERQVKFRANFGPSFNVHDVDRLALVRNLRFQVAAIVPSSIPIPKSNMRTADTPMWSRQVRLATGGHVHGIVRCLGFHEDGGVFHIAYAQKHISSLQDVIGNMFVPTAPIMEPRVAIQTSAIAQVSTPSAKLTQVQTSLSISGIICGLVDVTKGLLHLAKKLVVHTRVGPDTIWFDDTRHAFLTNFEHARLIHISPLATSPSMTQSSPPSPSSSDSGIVEDSFDYQSSNCSDTDVNTTDIGAFDDQVAFARLILDIFHDPNVSVYSAGSTLPTNTKAKTGPMIRHFYIPCMRNATYFRCAHSSEHNDQIMGEVRTGSIRLCELLRHNHRMTRDFNPGANPEECWPCRQFDRAMRHLGVWTTTLRPNTNDLVGSDISNKQSASISSSTERLASKSPTVPDKIHPTLDITSSCNLNAQVERVPHILTMRTRMTGIIYKPLSYTRGAAMMTWGTTLFNSTASSTKKTTLMTNASPPNGEVFSTHMPPPSVTAPSTTANKTITNTNTHHERPTPWFNRCATWLAKHSAYRRLGHMANDIPQHIRHMPIIHEEELQRIRCEMMHIAVLLLWDAHIWPRTNVHTVPTQYRPPTDCAWYQTFESPVRPTMVRNMHNALARMEVLLASMHDNLEAFAQHSHGAKS